MNGIQLATGIHKPSVHSPQFEHNFEHIGDERLLSAKPDNMSQPPSIPGTIALIELRDWRSSRWRSRTQTLRFVGLESFMVVGVRRSLVLAHRRSQQSCRFS